MSVLIPQALQSQQQASDLLQGGENLESSKHPLRNCFKHSKQNVITRESYKRLRIRLTLHRSCFTPLAFKTRATKESTTFQNAGIQHGVLGSDRELIAYPFNILNLNFSSWGGGSLPIPKMFPFSLLFPLSLLLMLGAYGPDVTNYLGIAIPLSSIVTPISVSLHSYFFNWVRSEG